MPTYEYRCVKCGNQFEKVQKMSDAPVAECPACGAGDAQRLISHSSFVLKGSGWYCSDYSKKSSGTTPEPSGGCCGCESGKCSH
ncbi:MAG TPA: zinc ribbon domain-containing protein [Myxococcota bacterium]|nr:zinc ribbon domain-containing protein [Myxococcota bacterium]HOC99171.1 zinc ribbon domain-containing protein [Myxococcota bacterium]